MPDFPIKRRTGKRIYDLLGDEERAIPPSEDHVSSAAGGRRSRLPMPPIKEGMRVSEMSDDQLRFQLEPQMHIKTVLEAREAEFRFMAMVDEIHRQIAEAGPDCNDIWRSRALGAMSRIRMKLAALQAWREDLLDRQSNELRQFYDAAHQVASADLLAAIRSRAQELR